MIKNFCYEDELKKALKNYDSKLDQSYLDKVNQYDLEFTEIFQFNEAGLKIKDENIAKMKEVFIHLSQGDFDKALSAALSLNEYNSAFLEEVLLYN